MSPIAFGPGDIEGLYDSPLGLMLAEPLLEGVAGTEQTINVMRQLVDQALRDSQIVRLATDIVRNAPAFDDYAEAESLYNWVRSNIRFTKDPVTKEKLYPPSELLKIRAGDCDDIAMLLGTLLMAVGYPARLVTVAAGRDPDQFSHVYVEGQVNGLWIPMDPARIDSQFGIEPPMFTRKRWWSLVDSSYGDLLSGTKIFADTVHVHGLSGYPRFRSVAGLGNYGRVRTMGAVPSCVYPDGSTDTNSSPQECASTGGTWSGGDAGAAGGAALVATTGASVADIIRASQGQPQSPYQAQVVAASQGYDPWASFKTVYSPGVSVPPGGYGSPTITATGVPSWFWLVVIGFGALALAEGKH